MLRSVLACFLVFFPLFLLNGCGGGGGGGPVTGRYALTVLDDDGTTPVDGAQVTLFDADNAFVATAFADTDGTLSVTLAPGVYTARIQAQGYEAAPPQGVSAIPFTVTAGATHTVSIELVNIADPALVAVIRGNADTGGALVVAHDTTQDLAVSTVTASNGDYVLYNVAPGTYEVTAFKAGFTSDTITRTVAALDDVTGDLVVAAQSLPTLDGAITFLATANGIVDVTLRHPETLDTVPGLTAQNNTGTSYAITQVPAGDYLAWATFANDGYVMDPDWVNKNGGYPDALMVTMGSTAQIKDFSVTGAVSLSAPTNPADEVVPVVVDTLTPTFSWLAYSSTQQYVVEVRDLRGNRLWGGYDFDPLTEKSTFRHPDIGTSLNAVYDFDSSATAPLEDGKVYQWRVYAFKWNTPRDSYVAISSSEDQRGLFRVQLPPP